MIPKDTLVINIDNEEQNNYLALIYKIRIREF